ncbi:MAG: ATP-binding protein [Rhodocyclaceae bacterium]|nr:ATP-binding protein [Rhodocyclaceae bacterium]
MSGQTRWFSLRRRLLVWLLGGITIGWLGAMGVVYFEARHELAKLHKHEEKRDRHEARDRLREEFDEHFIQGLLTPLLFGLPLLGGWIWFATRRGLAPLDEVAAELGKRAPERLDPVAPAVAPREIRPLLEALNKLFTRVDRALENERRFTADAAHELRTPLAAIAAQAQVALRARDAAERDHAIAQLAAGARRASHLVEQLLTLARLDPAAGLPMDTVRLDELAVAICADHGVAALEKNIALELAAPAPVSLMANDAMLRILLRNLLDNAVRYTPAGGQVRVAVTSTGSDVLLMVSDSGPGIPADQRDQALRRLHRLAGQDIEGSGLGLSIVARIAELHGAHLELADGIGQPGLAVRLTFPR